MQNNSVFIFFFLVKCLFGSQANIRCDCFKTFVFLLYTHSLILDSNLLQISSYFHLYIFRNPLRRRQWKNTSLSLMPITLTRQLLDEQQLLFTVLGSPWSLPNICILQLSQGIQHLTISHSSLYLFFFMFDS